MYAHQVLEGLISRKVLPVEIDRFNYFIPKLNEAIKFHFGEVDSFADKVKHKILFNNNILGFPYDTMWVDMHWGNGGHKIGILLVTYSPTVAFVKNFVYSSDNGFWGHSMGYTIVLLGGCTKNNLNILEQLSPDIRDMAINNKGSNVLSWIPKNEFSDLWGKLEHTSVSLLDTCLTLLSCKNIVQETIKPPVKLNKKRIKNNKPPIYEYRVLRMVVPRSVKQSNGDTTAKGLYTLPVHVCIGHEKTYTKERPLFGKHVGTYWWQPQERGNKNKGRIDKEYIVEVECTQPK